MRTLQLDVKRTKNNSIMRLNIYIAGTCYPAILSKDTYELMLQDGCFIRDGKTIDCANVVNTTNEFIEINHE